MIDLLAEVADPRTYGWKAHYLSVLAHHGFAVPQASALAAEDEIDAEWIHEDTKYAVRSSGRAEDGPLGSHAGQFQSHLDVSGRVDVVRAIKDVRDGVDDSMAMGVIVQDMVTSPLVSGVAFSCHPVTADSTVAIVSWVSGLGEGLVSGRVPANDVLVQLRDRVVTSGDWPFDPELLSQLVEGLTRARDVLRGPVDIEWCVDEARVLWYLQLRPIVFPPPSVAQLDTATAFDGLPRAIATHHKISIRSEAARLGVPMSPARSVVATHAGGFPSLPAFPVGEHSAGRSVVLLHPTHVAGKVVRAFTRDGATDVDFFVRGCQRYAIRQYPQQADAAESVLRTLAIGLESSAMACVVEQEVLHAYATGILRRISDGYLIEVALGHFVPKGYVETSTFGLSDDLVVTFRSQVTQSKAYHFMNGHVIVETPPYEQINLTDSDLERVVCCLQPILDSRPGVALEFGLLAYNRAVLEPYMIDIADGDSAASPLTLHRVARGIVSAGVASGLVVDLRIQSVYDDLDRHLHDVDKATPGSQPVIYVAQRASIDLLPIVRAAHPHSGFIFESASLLAHLAVVLRERGLPAVVQQRERVDRLLATTNSLTIDTAASELVAEANP